MIAHPWALALLAMAPLLLAVHVYGDRRRRAALARWTSSRQPTQRRWERWLQAAAVIAIAIALADPGAHPVLATAKGSADIVFLLDVSRSMLAADIQPNRLARAKEIIGEIARQDRGNRLALVAFAGGQSVECPLTVDHAFFAEALTDASPSSVARGGTRIGDAIRFALERVLDNTQRDRRTLVVVTDGEDHESGPEQAATEASRAKVHVVSIGVAEEVGATVPVSATDNAAFLYRGAPVQSQLNAPLLQNIGSYRHITGVDAAAVYREWLAPSGQGKAPVEGTGAVWTALIALAVVLLAIEPRRAMAALLVSLLVLPARAQTLDERFQKGLEALDKHEWVAALGYFGDAARWAPDSAEARFNVAKTLYEMRSFNEAALSFEHAAKLAKDPHLKAQARLGQGNALYRDAMQAGVTMTELRASIAAYREALKNDPDLFAADINIIVVERRLRQVMDRQPPPLPGMPPRQPQSRPEANADDILRQSHRTQPPRTLAKPGPVDKDW